MQERWQDRSWIPDADDLERLRTLGESGRGQTLLRLIDEESLQSAVRLMSGPDFLDEQKLAFMQGQFQAFQIVAGWLTPEIDADEEIEDA